MRNIGRGRDRERGTERERVRGRQRKIKREKEERERESVKSAEASGLMTCRPVHAQLATATFSKSMCPMPDTRADFALLPLLTSKIHRALIEDLF